MTHREALEGLFAAWRTGDSLRAAAHFAIDGVFREARGERILGRDNIVAHFTRFFRDGPLWEFHVDDVIVEGHKAAVRYSFALIRFENERSEHSGCAFVTFDDGTIAEWREYEG